MGQKKKIKWNKHQSRYSPEAEEIIQGWIRKVNDAYVKQSGEPRLQKNVFTTMVVLAFNECFTVQDLIDNNFEITREVLNKKFENKEVSKLKQSSRTNSLEVPELKRPEILDDLEPEIKNITLESEVMS